VDIRPAVREIFTANGNTPLKVKDIVDAVADKLPDASREIVQRKMWNVKRTMLENVEYGKYRLKGSTPPA
jgi:hypothetical protein